MKKTIFALLCVLMALLLALWLFPPRDRPQPEPAPTVETLPPQTCPPETEPAPREPPMLEPEASDFVRVADFLPGVGVELPYATADNFTGVTIYDFPDAYLRYGTVKKLAPVQAALEERGLSLLIWDAFRPTEAQFRLWEACPDPRYVADPNKGFSGHSRGNTLDVTLMDREGNVLPMPTGFDDFTALADRDYSDCPEEARENALLLENLMVQAGFQPYAAEWWHFTDSDRYDVEEVFCPGPSRTWYAASQDPDPLCAAPGGEVLAQITPGEAVTLYAWMGEFAQVAYGGQAGYVLSEHLRPSATAGCLRPGTLATIISMR